MPDLSHEIEVVPPFFDIDSMDVVWHGHYVKYLELARCALLEKFDYGYVRMRESGFAWPIVDLRLKLSCGAADFNAFTVVIVLNVKGRVIGAVVDSVSDVCELGGDAIKPTPMMNSHVDMSFITGIANVGERMLILMDIEALMSASDMGLIESVN